MAGSAVARESLSVLRETIARIEGRPASVLAAADTVSLPALRPQSKAGDNANGNLLSLGLPEFDDPLGGGLPLDGLSEIRSGELRDAGAASGFMLALGVCILARKLGSGRLLWIGETIAGMEAGLPHAAGLADYGLDPAGLLYAAPRRPEDALWLAEAALASGAFAAVILEVRGNPQRFGLTESRRLSLKARSVGRPLLLLRQAGVEEASSALFRFHLRPAPAAARHLPDGSMLGGSIGNPVFHLTLEKSRLPAFSDIFLEWSAHDRQFFLANPHALPATGRSADPGAHFSASSDGPDRAAPMGSVVAFSRAS
ncbi:hypothetical protein MRS76_14080 [Rhizobiaceae bacterium n13]|uniref:Protein ImuA n=1 Tax=Ferirhizobium litorale TaxID=2927786 RepID=A0AAE3QCJ3_9HYPH|nr:hypothetical protein [Fererhizobium litorale]MDI7863086.1 hypothetical protein [Fererhizobium litorale]MDI7923237.1 hypothetical protein [Fererhizobium litorale]